MCGDAAQSPVTLEIQRGKCVFQSLVVLGLAPSLSAPQPPFLHLKWGGLKTCVRLPAREEAVAAITVSVVLAVTSAVAAEETGAQRGYVAALRSPRWEVGGLYWGLSANNC